MIIMGRMSLTRGAAAALVSLALVIVAGLSIAPASAAELHCVVCTGPDATYRCRVQTPGLPSGRPAMQYFCVTQVAKDKGHASCRVRRTTDDSCQGEERIYVMQSPPQSAVPPGAALPRRDPQPAVPQTAPPAEQKRTDGPPGKPVAREPKTVDEMAKQSGQQIKKTGQDVGRAISKSAKTTGKAIGKATKSAERQAQKVGKTVSQAAKKSWRCLKSLFQKC